MGARSEWSSDFSHMNEDDYDWIVGCDGAHSQIRHRMSQVFAGGQFSETFLLIDAAINTEEHLHGPNFFLHKTGLVAIVPLHKKSNHFRLIFPLRKNETVEEQTKESLNALLIRKNCPEFAYIEEIFWRSEFHIHRRMVKHFRKGKFFLAGDAAHIHSPVGGQGMNTSIQDAHNLGWKLALAVQNRASSLLLDSYEKEHKPVAKSVLKGTTRATKMVTFFSKSGLTTLFSLFVSLLRTKIVRRFLAEHVSELALQYKTSSINQRRTSHFFSRGAKPGQRAPDVVLENKKRLFDYLRGGKCHLLLFEENREIQIYFSEKWKNALDIVIIADDNLKKAYGVSAKGVFIIRPDGVIGFRGKKVKVEEVENYLLKVFKHPF
jgi:hypothetical protein